MRERKKKSVNNIISSIAEKNNKIILLKFSCVFEFEIDIETQLHDSLRK